MLNENKKKVILEKWRQYLYPNATFSDEELFELFINYAIDQEFEAIVAWEVKRGKEHD